MAGRASPLQLHSSAAPQAGAPLRGLQRATWRISPSVQKAVIPPQVLTCSPAGHRALLSFVSLPGAADAGSPHPCTNTHAHTIRLKV